MARRRRQPAIQLTLVEEVEPVSAKCRRCGRLIRSKAALFIGMGSKCARLSGYKGPMKQADIILDTAP